MYLQSNITQHYKQLMRPILVLVLFFIISTAGAQQKYDASLISKDLLHYASSVIRDEQLNVEVKDLDNVVYQYKVAITVLNKNGDDMAHIAVYHDKITIIKNIKGAIYNSFGIAIGKFSESDFEDKSTSDGFSLFEDTRVKTYYPAVTEYPYTIEYEYETRSKQSLYFDDWEPDPQTGVAIEKSVFTFTCKPDFHIRYKEINMPTGAYITTDNASGSKTYTWQLNNLNAVKHEPFSPNEENYLSMVKIAPEKFSYYGINGSFTNWTDLGKWIYDKLIAGRQELPAETITNIKEITSSIADPKLKAKKIYEYMQGKTHYVSVQVGIGGFQPFLASDVDKQNYGDCKALVNYTKAMLNAVGINSYYCVVMANDERKISLLSDFASMNQANHIILCIPFKNDTTWCDCTSQTIPFGYLGDFTDDRNVLACTPEGGKLLHTPKYTAQTNSRYRKANFIINEKGELSGDMVTIFKGTRYDERDYEIEESPVERFKDMQYVYPINNMHIEKLEFAQDKSFQPFTTENIKLKATEFATIGDGKIYFMLNPIGRVDVPKQVHNRLTDVYINEGFTSEDEISYTLPPGYRLDDDPINLSLNKPFGKFTATMSIVGNQLIFKRKLEVFDGTYPKDVYQDLVDFYQAIADADSYNVAFIKNN